MINLVSELVTWLYLGLCLPSLGLASAADAKLRIPSELGSDASLLLDPSVHNNLLVLARLTFG